MRDLEGFVLLKPMFGHQPREEPAIHPPRHVVTRGDGQEGARIVVETNRVVEAGCFRHLLAEAAHAFGTIVEPPGGPSFSAG